IGGDGAVKFPDCLQWTMRIELQPVTEDDVAVRTLHGECVIVVLADFSNRQEFREREIEHHPRVVAAKVIGHLVLRDEGCARLPDLFLLRELGFGAEDVAAPGAPVGMAIEYPHAWSRDGSVRPASSISHLPSRPPSPI